MAMEAKPKSFLLPIFISLLLLLSFSTPTIISPSKSPSLAAGAGEPSASPTPIDPKQLRALQSLNIPISNEYDPCSNSSSSSSSCDAASPFRHLLSLRLADCSDDVQISNTALKYLSSLINFHLFNCPVAPVQFPTQLALNLRSFTCINSFRRLTGVWLSRLHNVTDLTVSGVYVNSSGPSIILANMKQIQSLTISQANLSGFLPKQWHFNITHIDFSCNKLRGKIPISITLLENLQLLNLSSNELVGELPDSIGNLMSLKNISLSSNYLSGTVPESMASIPTLVHLDLGSNQFNGTIPKFIADMKELKYLNLEHNNFRGIMPFNESFIKRLEVLKIGGNDNLCYDRSTLPARVKMAIAPCDKHGLPMSPPPPAEERSSSADEMSSSENGDYSDIKNEDDQHGRSKVVFGVTIGITSMVFLMVFLNLLSKWCGSEKLSQ